MSMRKQYNSILTIPLVNYGNLHLKIEAEDNQSKDIETCKQEMRINIMIL